MSKKMDTQRDQGSWIEWEDGASFKLRPYPITLMEPVEDANFKDQINQTVKIFKYCIIDWKGLEDQSTGKPIACNDKWKDYMFENYEELRSFVMDAINKVMGVSEEEGKEQKN